MKETQGMKLSIATLVIGAMLACTANAAPPASQPAPKQRVVTCDQARPGTKLWKECSKKKVVKQPKAAKKAPVKKAVPAQGNGAVSPRP